MFCILCMRKEMWLSRYIITLLIGQKNILKACDRINRGNHAGSWNIVFWKFLLLLGYLWSQREENKEKLWNFEGKNFALGHITTGLEQNNEHFPSLFNWPKKS